MPLPVSGPISFNDINVELGVAGTTQASLGQSSYRTLAGVPSGQISMSNFYGKSNQFAFTISTNQTNANLASLATSAGWNGSSKLIATIGSGVYVSSNSTGTPGLTVSGSFPGGVELINNGFIIGMGGAGGRGGGLSSGSTSGGAGGTALSTSVAISITNNGTVGGGGGGGGAGNRYDNLICDKNGCGYDYIGGGGGGGGRTGLTNSAGGAGGTGTSGGGRDGAAGGSGTSSSAGGGGSGGAGNSYGNSGTTGGNWGSAGSSAGTSGGAGGAAVSGNSNITWLATGTRLGALT